jgi:hypothetical protein
MRGLVLGYGSAAEESSPDAGASLPTPTHAYPRLKERSDGAQLRGPTMGIVEHPLLLRVRKDGNLKFDCSGR